MKKRIDLLLVERKLVETRSKAQAHIMAGQVFVDGQIVKKSGETYFSNSNIILKNTKNNIFVTENKKNYLTNLANEIGAEIIEHKNFIGGRYSVLSEVGMFPAELMGVNEKKFKQFNILIKNKLFFLRTNSQII